METAGLAEQMRRSTVTSAVVILAAGTGSRVGADRNKVLLPLAGEPILVHSVRTALATGGVHRIVVVVRPGERDEVAAAVAPYLGQHDVWLVDGGAERHDSEYAALVALRGDIEAGEIDVIAIHDGARPLASAALFEAVVARAMTDGGAVPAVATGPLSDRSGRMVAGAPVAVQTPQAFRAAPLLAAYDRADVDGFRGTDTASCLARYAPDGGVVVGRVAGERTNLKVTYPDDLAVAAELVASDPSGPGRGA